MLEGAVIRGVAAPEYPTKADIRTWFLAMALYARNGHMYDIKREESIGRPKRLPRCGKADELDAAEWVRQKLGITPDPLQAEVLRTSTKRGMLNCCRQWGKSTITAAKAVHQAQSCAGSLTLVVSPSSRQSAEFLRKASEFARRIGIRPKGDGDNEISLALPNGSRMVGLPGTEATIRGFSAVSLLLVDEASRVSDELYLSIRPMLAVSDGTLWLMSTPHGQQGFFHDTWAHGGAEWRRFRAPATECPRIGAAFLEEERAAMGERWFRQEYLCEFGESMSGVFGREMVERAIRDDVAPLVLK